jgi:predicted GNAT superfamily acetyltransferase
VATGGQNGPASPEQEQPADRAAADGAGDPPGPDSVAAAHWQARGAAIAAAVRMAPLTSLAGVQEAERLFADVWGAEGTGPPLPCDVMRAVEHCGGYVFGAYTDERMVGASVGFLGLEHRKPVLHSHISGAVVQGRGVGLALKLHQRAWALDRGITAITWTFDPLVRRNAWFNLAKLGAVGVEYLVDFYGAIADGLNRGDSSDRLLTRWDLGTTRCGPVLPGSARLLIDEAGNAPQRLDPQVIPGEALLIRLPRDIEALRSSAPGAAVAWRLAVREALQTALASGLTVRGITQEGCLLIDR